LLIQNNFLGIFWTFDSHIRWWLTPNLRMATDYIRWYTLALRTISTCIDLAVVMLIDNTSVTLTTI